MIYSGVFERYPRLKVVNVEHQLARIPHFMDRLDYVYRESHEQTPYRYKDNMVPSDFMRRNVFHSFEEDNQWLLGIRDRYIIGVDNLMWASDYPHAEGVFPYSQQVIEKWLKGVPEEEKAKICGETRPEYTGLSK